MKTLTILVLIIISFSEIYSQPSQVWLQSWNSQSTGNYHDRPEVIKMDLSGNIYVAGVAKGRNDIDWLMGDYVLIKYNSAGVQQWVKTYNGIGNNSDWILAMAIDSSGNVYVTGWSDRCGTYDACKDIVTIKYNPNGDSLWGVRYNGGYNGGNSSYDVGNGILVDNSGNVYVTGSTMITTSVGIEYVTIKYNTNGIQQWIKVYNGTDNKHDYAKSIALDNSGNVIITGYTGGNGNHRFCTVKYNSSGDTSWVRYFDGTVSNGVDEAIKVVTDINNNIYITGESQTGFFSGGRTSDFITIKYNSSGVQQWLARFSNRPSPIDSSFDVPRDMEIDNAGNIYITGSSLYKGSGNSNQDFVTIKYNTNGDSVWVRNYNYSEDIPFAVTLDNQNNVYVTGHTSSLPTSFDYNTIKYNSSGVQQWVATYNGGEQDVARDIIVDNSGYVYVTGYSLGTGTDIVTIKYDNVTGIKVIGNELPAEYKLHQNYPNPFNPSTNIEFYVPKSNYVTLKIYDALGREIATLVNEQLKAGTYQVDWNASNYASGVYYYRLATKDYVETKKMILIK
jgi:uncharacterized delta-60 repeat protein